MAPAVKARPKGRRGHGIGSHKFATGGYGSQADGFITADEHFFIALARLKRGKLPWLVLWQVVDTKGVSSFLGELFSARPPSVPLRSE